MEGLQKACYHIMVLQFLPENEPLDGVIVGEEGHKVLQEETFAVGQQILGRIHLEYQIKVKL